MLFPAVGFALFLLPVWVISWALHGWHRVNKLFLLVASYLFYAAWDWRFCGLLFASSVGNHLIAKVIHVAPDRQRRLVLYGCIAANLAVLGWFKYWGFFAANADDFLVSVGLEPSVPLMGVILPVGISFFTFHAISYVVDVYRGTMSPARSLLDVLLYISFFPHLVAGPIVRASCFLPQLAHPTDRDDIRLSAALVLIVSGLVKKVLIADYLASALVDPAFLDPQRQSAIVLWLGVYGYAVQIFCDFYGYTDMAIGIAALFGYRFPMNFNQPYRSVSLQEFWTRWHISLSSWLRDYLYIPLGGSHRGQRRTCVNLLATMALGGLWHGASWTSCFGVCCMGWLWQSAA
jgi:alginate O-acetyltransferase complex protein AlgI